MLEQPVPEARHAPFYDWMGVVTCSVSEATVGRPSKPSVDKERSGAGVVVADNRNDLSLESN